MRNVEQKKREIASRLSRNRPVMSEREKEIHEINTRSANEGLKMRIRDRHARRHQGVKGTSLSERKEAVNQMSKDY